MLSAQKIKHQRLALALFQDDVRQVIEWIDAHGEVRGLVPTDSVSVT